jgi:hypothetical protein
MFATLNAFLPLVVYASVAAAQPFSVALWGDLVRKKIHAPYFCYNRSSKFSHRKICFLVFSFSTSQPYLGSTVSVFNNSDIYGPQYENLRDSINSNGLTFAVHTGDTKSGSTLCNDVYYGRFQQLANSLNIPTAYTIGDNEWTDCHRTAAGLYNPLERLSAVRSRFFSAEGKTILGGGTPLRVNSFGINPYIENQFFSFRGITFTLLHVPGSNNNLYDGSPLGQPCPSTINATDPNCAAENAEFRARDAANGVSLRYMFNVAKLNQSPLVVVVIQADFFNTDAATCDAANVTLANIATRIPTGFQNFTSTLLTETANFAGKVLLVHGDSHFYRRCNPFRPLTNIEVVMVPGSDSISWLKANFNPNSTDLYSLQHFPQCTTSYGLYNAATDTQVSLLRNGDTISSPPCSVNIRVNVTCAEPVAFPQVVMQVRSLNGNIVQTRTEKLAPYYLFGDAGTNVLGGAISAGTYTIDTTYPGVIMPKPLTFTFGQCV